MELKGKLALVVDDEEFLREIISEELQRKGVTVIEATNGEEAFKLFQTNSPDIIITDLRMPGGNGIDLLEKIKATSTIRPVVVLITAYSDFTDDAIFDMGADAVFSKPFKPKALVMAVEKCLMPLSEKLTTKHEDIHPKLELEYVCNSLASAEQKGDLIMGRGGMFLATADQNLKAKDYIKFKIMFSETNQMVTGIALCQWIRRNSSNNLKIGAGLEIIELNPEGIDLLFNNLEQKKAFIPKS